MNFLESTLSKHIFNEHAENISMVGGMPLTELLGNTAFVGGAQIANLENARFKNLVVPAGFFVELRSASASASRLNNEYPQYINEKAFEELFGISIRSHSSNSNNRARTRVNKDRTSNKISKKIKTGPKYLKT